MSVEVKDYAGDVVAAGTTVKLSGILIYALVVIALTALVCWGFKWWLVTRLLANSWC